MEGQLLYICISRGNTILAEFTQENGNFRTLMPKVLQHSSPNRRDELKGEQYNFYLQSTDTHVFAVLTSREYPKRIAFDALANIKQAFYDKFTADQRNTAIDHALTNPFKTELKEKYAYYNSSKCDNILKLKQNVNDLKDVVQDDLQKLLDRGQKLDVIVMKSKNMKDVSTQLHKNARTLKSHMWWQNKKMTLIIAVIVIIAIWLVTSFICGFSYSNC